MIKKHVLRNIKTMYFTSLLSEMYFVIPIWLLFYLKYISFGEIALLTSVRVVVANFLELPTGAFADLVGKKFTIVLAYGVYVLAIAAIIFGPKVFLFFFIWELLRGVSKALFSGASEALIYDSLIDGGIEDDYDVVYSKIQAYEWIGLFIGSFLGGVLYDSWNLLPYILVLIAYVIAFFVSVIYLTEPDTDSTTFTKEAYLRQTVLGFKELFANRYISLTTILLLLVSFTYFLSSEILGVSQGEEYGLSGTQIGFMFGTGYVISAILSYRYKHIRDKVPEWVITLLPVGAVLSSLIFANSVGLYIGAMLIIMRISSSTMFINVRSKTVNRYISSKNRATALSTLSFLYQIPYAILAYFLGDYIDKTSANEFASRIGGVLAGIIIVVYVVRWELGSTDRNSI